jgi:hypothetical protein
VDFIISPDQDREIIGRAGAKDASLVDSNHYG